VRSKTAIITGGSKGIGLRIARILAERKYNIVICSRNHPDLIRAKKELEKYGIKCLALKADVSDYKQCKMLVRKTLENFLQIDLLVNNAGYQGPIGKLWLNNLEDWEKTIKINLLGVFYMLHLVVPSMIKRRKGLIINISGGGGAYARPLFSGYATSKAAVLRLTETLARELEGTNVNVVAVGPGATWTDMTKSISRGKKNKLLDKKTLAELKTLKITRGTSFDTLKNLMIYLIKASLRKLSGRLLHVNELPKIKKYRHRASSDIGLLRRINFN